MKKCLACFAHTTNHDKLPIFRGFDDEFFIPHSRHTEVRQTDIDLVPELQTIASSPKSGPGIIMARNGRQFFLTGHSEYSRFTLDTEYKRDVKKGLPIHIPENYYPDNNPEKEPVMRWKSHANLLSRTG
jgi:homoserine O-succinyltransferase